MENKNLESKTGDIVGMSFDITGPTSADAAPIMDIDNTTPLFRNTSSTNKGNALIGDDGKLYPTPESLEEANKIYWDNWKKINAAGGMSDLSHLRALDGSYHSNPERIKEANRQFREKYAAQGESISSQKTELLNQLLANPKYALDCAGLRFIKQIYQIDPELAQDILGLILNSTKNNDIENLEPSFIQLITSRMDVEKNNEKLR